MTYTHTTLEVSATAFDEIARKLHEAGYHDAFHGGVIDMRGIGLVRRPDPVMYWALNEDPTRAKLPQGTTVTVDGESAGEFVAFDVEQGYVRALCGGRKPGHPKERHLDQETDRACEVVLRGAVEVRIA